MPVAELIVELGRESGALHDNEHQEAFVNDVLDWGEVDHLGLYEKAAAGDVAALVTIRRRWGLRPLV